MFEGGNILYCSPLFVACITHYFDFHFDTDSRPMDYISVAAIAVICVTKSRTGDYDFRACARARGFRGSTFSVGHIRFAVCAERSRDKTCVF